MSKVLEHFSTGGRLFKRFIESTLKVDVARLHKYATQVARAGIPIQELNSCARELKAIEELRDKAKPDPGAPAFPLGYAFRELNLTQDLSVQFVAPLEDVHTKLQTAITANVTFALAQLRSGAVLQKLPQQVNVNQVSLAFLLRFGAARVLVCGDVLDPQWTQVLLGARAQSVSLKADLISVSHHGGAGNSRKLWRAISHGPPRTSTAIISCGYDNQYGHPTETTLNRILASDNQLFCINKGAPCQFLDVANPTPFAAAIRSVVSPPDGFTRAMRGLGAVDDICSGTIEAAVDAAGVTVITSREQKSICKYAEGKGFQNSYPAGI